MFASTFQPSGDNRRKPENEDVEASEGTLKQVLIFSANSQVYKTSFAWLKQEYIF